MNDQSAKAKRGSSALIEGADNAVFASMNNDFMCVIDADGTIKRFNDNFKTAIKSCYRGNILESIADDDKAAVRQFLQSLSKEDNEDITQDLLSMEFEARMKTAKKSVLWMQWKNVF